ncbi:hypothetical protein [Mesorhizobium sp. B2-3-4]|uniref:hypothetical protein n=1 Tax=Mesorhizobium sp. B2-3-4 TaxID=2589959 RepID=UPI0011279CAF|nr:hypothetical protein [Mesorhizobium sp. B2-3-4]TPM34153.1 hypothetical protein FJ967_22190 [Mesorhizobium sp. B2-3-4]
MADKKRGSLRNVVSGIVAKIGAAPHRASERGANTTASIVAEWPLPPSVTLGSAARLKGIEREIRARLPWVVRKFAKAETGRIVLRMLSTDADAFQAASATIARTLEKIESLAVLPREVEDILAISPRERHKWLKDGRLKSIGTRTVKMRGRSKAVTFHVFDPRHIEDLLDRDLVSAWREEDAREVSENRRRGAGKAALTRAGKQPAKPHGPQNTGNDHARKDDAPRPKLEGWDTFEAEGLLR